MRSPSRRIAGALAVSLAVHALLVLWIRGMARPPSPAPVAAPLPIEVEVTTAPVPEPLRPGPDAPQRSRSRPHRTAQPTVPSRAEAVPPASVAAAGPAGEAAGAESQPPAEPLPPEPPPLMAAEPPAPRVRLFPEIPGVAAGVASGLGGTARPGRTLRAWEPPAPPSEADRAREAAEAQAVVQGTLDEAQATYRTDTGLVDTYFAEMANALRAGTESPPPLTPGATFVENLLSAWMPGAAAWARTGGNPYAAGQQGEVRRPESHEGQLSRLAQQAPGTEADVINRSFQSGAMFRDFADGRFGDGIVALVELRQAGDGKLEGAALVRSSGNPLFDAHVMQTAPAALERLAPAPERLVGARPDGFRSLWSFEGRILFKTKKKPHELTLRDVAGAAAMLALNAVTQKRDEPNRSQSPGSVDDERTRGAVPFTGSFDETSGEVGLVDLTQPRFHCRVKLLRVY